MELQWLRNLYGHTVSIDTAPLIYFVEEHPKYRDAVTPFFQSADAGHLDVVTSMITLVEVLVHPYRRENESLAKEYTDILLHAPHVHAHALTAIVAQEAARLRAKWNMKTPDAIQLATATCTKATAFLTNDTGFPDIPGLDMILLDDII